METLNDGRNIGIPNTYFSSENLYQNEFIWANEVHHRADEALINGYLAANYPPLMMECKILVPRKQHFTMIMKALVHPCLQASQNSLLMIAPRFNKNHH